MMWEGNIFAAIAIEQNASQVVYHQSLTALWQFGFPALALRVH
jgi:hypothetical protein